MKPKHEFTETLSIHCSDGIHKEVFIRYLKDFGYRISKKLDDGRGKHIWINEKSCDSEYSDYNLYGIGKVRFAYGRLNKGEEPDCKYFELPSDFYEALYEASKVKFHEQQEKEKR